jgi:N-acetylmuramic acid 6-phosphate etherase
VGGTLAVILYPTLISVLPGSGSAKASVLATRLQSVLDYLKIKSSPQSLDYVHNKKQFQLHTLLTEQRHPKTWSLSGTIQKDTRDGLKMLLSVDEDISTKIGQFTKSPAVLDQAAHAIYRAITSRKQIYFYGCGATGRLAKQMESTFWRPFWVYLKAIPLWDKLKDTLPEDIEDRLIGEMTGADRALISSLEGFEDLQVIGRLQLLDRGIKRGDTVFCVTEGGETSSVIGTILAALEQYGELNHESSMEAKSNLYFVYNNPDELLIPFDRSRSVLENTHITKINLTTGPQAITGSTRMQATTSETFVLGAVVEEAIYRILKEHLTLSELEEIGFKSGISLSDRIATFEDLKKSIDQSIGSIARFTDMESDVYSDGRFTTYFAKKALTTVFIDSTERSPTFRLFPLDTVDQKERKSWIQVWTDAANGESAWRSFLGRDFRGMEESYYKPSFLSEIDDPYLKEAAMRSLANAGNDQRKLYDLSFSRFNKEYRQPLPGDLCVVICVENEIDELSDSNSSFSRFMDFSKRSGARVVLVTAGRKDVAAAVPSTLYDLAVEIALPPFPDPIHLRAHIAIKMLLNAHSTAVMAKLGRVIGNTMTTVNPGNLKLIGRATSLILMHVNDSISRKTWIDRYGVRDLVTFEEANAVLFDAMENAGKPESGQTAEVALSIIRILVALQTEKYISWNETRTIMENKGLEGFLKELNPVIN